MLSTLNNDKENESQTILKKPNFEKLTHGCIRQWYLLHFPDVLIRLITHYFGTTFIWTINKKDENDDNPQFISNPYIVNGITFQSFFKPNVRKKVEKVENMKANASVIAPDLDTSKINKTYINYGYLYTKILSMPNTIRTCTVYYEYTILNKTYKSRHTFNLTPSKAELPKFSYLKGTEDDIYPLPISICIDPIRIHYWSYDKLTDYQQDIMMNKHVKYQWIIKPENRNVLQSDIFGNCWCLDLDTFAHLKLLRLPPNITRIQIECCIRSANYKKKIMYKEELEFGFGDKRGKVKDCGNNDEYNDKEDTIIEIEIKVIEVYAIDGGNVDDFELEDLEIPSEDWSKYGIV